LRARGYRFVTISQLAGMTRDQAMPPVTQEKGFFSKANAVAFYSMAIGGWALRWAFLIGAALVLARLAVIGALAFAEWLRSRQPAGARGSGGAGGAPFGLGLIAGFRSGPALAP